MARNSFTHCLLSHPHFVYRAADAPGGPLTLAILARRAGIAGCTLTQHLRWQKPIRLEVAKKMAKAMGCRVEDIIIRPARVDVVTAPAAPPPPAAPSAA